MQVTKHKVVTIDYTLTDESGEVLDTSRGGEPLAYIQGVGAIIPGLESALEGRSTGESLKVAVAPEDGYGVRDEALTQKVPREAFDVEDLEVGMQFRAQADDEVRVFTVVAVDDAEVTVDGNHPLAGMPLHFDVTVVDVRDATEEEISHGHAHGADGHHH